MNIRQPSASSIAGLVWTQTTRGITSVQAAHTMINGQTSVAAGATLDVRPSANKLREVTLIPDTFTTGFQSGYYTGAFVGSNANNPQGAAVYGVADSVVGIAIHSTNGGAANVTFIG